MVNQGRYSPTVGAFGMYADKSLESAWIFNINDTNSTAYAYPEPAPNDPLKPPLPAPN